MIISYIEREEYIYINLHAEEVISSNYLNDDNQGIYIGSLQFETVNRIFNFIKGLDTIPQKYIVLDFKNLEHIQANILDKITDVRDLGFKLYVFNVF